MKKEPVAIGGIVSLLAALAVIFGLDLTEAQLAGAVSVIVTLVTLLQRRKVKPTSKIDEENAMAAAATKK